MDGPTLQADQLHLLQDAFRCFDRAAESLEDTYRALTARVAQLDVELAASNEALRANLRENEEIKAHLAAILESLTTGVLVTNADDVILRANEAAERLLGVPRSEIVGQTLRPLLKRLGINIETYPVAAPSGVPLATSQALLKSADEGPAGGILLLHDVSTVRRLEQQVQRRDRLVAMGEMVGRIAHEIRNPLGSIELFASMLRRDLTRDPERRRYAEHISVAVQAMDRLLANLLAYARPDCSHMRRHGVKAIVEEVCVLAAHGLSRTSIVTDVAVADDLMMWCDAGQLRQALLNLVLNAVQAMPDGGRLAIAVVQDTAQKPADPDSWIRIAVSDTGVGIPTADLARVCDPFYSTREEGTGLGLAIVHAIVEAHGGRIAIESEVGVGTTVTLRFPDAPVPVPAMAGGAVLRHMR